MDNGKTSTTKTFILDSARKLINEKGYAKTTYRELSKETNLSLGAITHYFKTKSDLAYRLSLEGSIHYNNQIAKIIKSHGLDLITGDSVHICNIVNIYLSDEKYMNYYYDLVKDNCLHKISLQLIYMQFLKKFNHLKIKISNQTIYSYSLILIGMSSEFVRAQKENRLHLKVEEMVDIYIRQTLRLLQLSDKEINSVLDISNSIYKNIAYDTTDIYDIKLFDKN